MSPPRLFAWLLEISHMSSIIICGTMSLYPNRTAISYHTSVALGHRNIKCSADSTEHYRQIWQPMSVPMFLRLITSCVSTFSLNNRNRKIRTVGGMQSFRSYIIEARFFLLLPGSCKLSSLYRDPESSISIAYCPFVLWKAHFQDPCDHREDCALLGLHLSRIFLVVLASALPLRYQ